MMNAIGTYISSVIENGFRKLKFRRFGRADIMSSYLGTAFGEDYIPSTGKVVQIGTTNSNENIVVAVVRAADDTLNIGDKVIYSTDTDGNTKAQIYLRNDGTIEIIGDSVVFQNGEDFAVKYSDLETQFNELNDKFNALAQTWNTFAASYIPGGPSTQGLPATTTTVSESTADITQTKVETIKIP